MQGPVRWSCPDPCSTRFQIGAETTIVGYHRQPWFSHFVVVCPQCNQRFVSFQTPEIVLHALTTMQPDDRSEVEFSDFAPDEVVAEFARQKGKAAITEHYRIPEQRSARHLKTDDNHAKFFAYLLDQGEMPDGC